jgi:hypothetical protein
MSKEYKKYVGKEDQFQISCAIYLNSLGLLWNHTANERETSARRGFLFKKKGVKSGFPDISILETTSKYKGLFIELKKGYLKTRDNQKEWIKKLNTKGYFATWTNSLDEFMDILRDYTRGEPMNKYLKLK